MDGKSKEGERDDGERGGEGVSSGNCKHDQIMTQAHRENQQSRAKGASFAKEEQGNDGAGRGGEPSLDER